MSATAPRRRTPAVVRLHAPTTGPERLAAAHAVLATGGRVVVRGAGIDAMVDVVESLRRSLGADAELQVDFGDRQLTVTARTPRPGRRSNTRPHRRPPGPGTRRA